ncbi:MAG: PDZ domain-containing protein [Planctomycetales bacterium]|nr:PDZ domain-containing protein [Planctomycetales bacterium]
MRKDIDRSVVVAFVISCLVGLLASDANAQDRRNPGRRSRNFFDAFELTDPSYLATRIGKNHELVKSAFRDVVAIAAESTVRVIADGKQVAFGVGIEPTGYVVTKHSEVRDAKRLQVRMGGQSGSDATIEFVDADVDLAILKTELTKLKPAEFSTDKPPSIGSLLASAGSQMREPIVVGIVGTTARTIHPERAALGVTLQQNVDLAQVSEVLQNSSADKAGLKPDDIVKRVNDRTIGTSGELIRTIRRMQPGDVVTLSIERGAEAVEVTAVLGRQSDIFMPEQAIPAEMSGDLSVRRSGFPDVIQHDSVISPNQCGGPIVDIDGKIVGLNIARAGRIETYALSAATVKRLLDRWQASR